MSENQGNEQEVERTTETTTESAQVPNHPDPREELRTPDPEVVQETVTETVSESPADDGDDDSDADAADEASEKQAADGFGDDTDGPENNAA